MLLALVSSLASSALSFATWSRLLVPSALCNSSLSPPLLFPSRLFIGERHWSDSFQWGMARSLPKLIGHHNQMSPTLASLGGCVSDKVGWSQKIQGHEICLSHRAWELKLVRRWEQLWISWTPRNLKHPVVHCNDIRDDVD